MLSVFWYLVRRVGCVLVGMLIATSVLAHQSSASYLNLAQDGMEFSAQCEIAVHDLAPVLGLDGNDDGLVTWPEIRARGAEIATYATACTATTIALFWLVERLR